MAWRPRPTDDFQSTYDKHEVPWAIRTTSDDSDDVLPEPNWLQKHRAATDLQAMMEAPPGVEPEQSVAEQRELAELLADVMDQLRDEDPRGWWVFTAHTNRGLSFREIGLELNISKAGAALIYHTTRDKLQARLSGEPLINERFDQ